MSAQNLLARLEGVRATGSGRWLARCAAHEDRSPSLSIRELSDGRILVYCFAGCEVHDVLASVGLELKDLFPEPLPKAHGEGYGPARERIHPADALKLLDHEATLAAIVASDAAEGRPISAEDADRAALAAGRIRAALDATGATA